MLKDAIVDYRLPVQAMLAVQIDGGMTPGQVAITSYDTTSPVLQEGLFKADQAAFSLLAVNAGEDAANFQYPALARAHLEQADISRRSRLQPNFTKYLFSHFTKLCSSLTLQRRNLIAWNLPMRNVSFLRSLSRPYISDLFFHVSSSQPYITWVLINEPLLFHDIPVVLPHIPTLQPAISFAIDSLPTFSQNHFNTLDVSKPLQETHRHDVGRD
ncbi:hypothetical protein DXG01_015060, partial [Tephrocybe rancida]